MRRGVRALLVVSMLAVVPMVATPAHAVTAPRYDGKIAITGGTDSSPNFLWVVNPDGTGYATIPGATGGIFSPDGSKLVFGGTVDGVTGTFIADADGANPHLISSRHAFLAWSGDGTRLAFDDSFDIVTMNIDGSDVRNVTNTPGGPGGMEQFPSWSPDGTKLVFVQAQSDADQICVMNADGSGVTVLASMHAFLQAPTFSHDGTRIAFDAVLEDQGRIFTMNVDGSALTDAADAPVGFGPTWSADDSKFAFVGQGANHAPAGVGIMNVDGTNVRMLDNVPLTDSTLSWQSLPSPTPAFPRDVAVTPRHGSLQVSWSAPLSDGGSAVMAYGVEARKNGVVVASQGAAADVRSISIPGLTDGTAYDVVVRAFNRNGPGDPSSPTSATPSQSGAATTTPSSPQNMTAGAGNGSVSVWWAPSATDGGAPITAFSVIVTDPATGRIVAWTNAPVDAREASADGLVNGHAYSVAVVAWNAKGIGAAASATATPVSSRNVGSPGPVGLQSVVVANAGAGHSALGVYWTVPAYDNGAPITAYSVVVLQGGHVVAWVNVGAQGGAASIPSVTSGVATTVYVLPSNRYGFTSSAVPMTLTS